MRRSLDARKGRPLGYNLRVLALGEPGVPPRGRRALAGRAGPAPGGDRRLGAGGGFAALRLAEAGVPATILERGKPVQPRRRDLAPLQRGSSTPIPTTASARAGPAPTPTASSTPAARTPGGGSGAGRSGALRRARRDRGRVAPARRFEPAAQGADRAARAPGSAGRGATGSRPRRRGCAPAAGGCGRCACAAARRCPPTRWSWRSAIRRATIYAWLAGQGVPIERKGIAVGRAHRAPAAGDRPTSSTAPHAGHPRAAAGLLRAQGHGRGAHGRTASACARAAGSCPPPPSRTGWWSTA